MWRLTEIFDDCELGLGRNVRLRAFCVNGALRNVVLNLEDLNDQRWGEILNETAFFFSTSKELQSLLLLSNHHSPEEARARIVERLSQSTATRG